MLLKELELAGFKSFAKKTKLSFASPIVAIVGPNGSGKSNVAEAFAFVLGEQSREAMRAKRGEDLIWNGSKNVSRLGRANVALVFDNREKLFDVDYDEVILSREVHRDGVNEYFVNGARSRLRDILELLASAHIGSSGHHIISQGETDRALTASPKERREMIEDALGLRIYEYKIDESEKKLAKTEENMKEAGLLRKELAPRMHFLKKQMEKIERTRALQGELAESYREYFRREEAYLAREKENISRDMEGPRKELMEVEHLVALARKKMKQGDEKNMSAELLRIEALQKRVRGKKDEISHALGRAEGMIEIETSLAKAAPSGEGSQEAMIPAGKVREFAGIVRGLLDEALEKGGLEDVKSTLARLKIKIREFVESMEAKHGTGGVDLREGMNERETALLALEEEREELIAELEFERKEEERLFSEYEKLRSESEKGRETERLLERELFELMGKERELSLALDDARRRQENLEREEREMKQELGEAGILAGRSATEYKDEQGEDHEPREEQMKRRKSIERMKIRLEELGIGSGEDVVKEFEEVAERDQFLERETGDLEKSAESLRGIIDGLHDELKNRFENGLKKINERFQDFFSLLFGGGTAGLLLIVPKKRKTSSGDEFADISEEDKLTPGIASEAPESGLEINIALPQKRLCGIQMLSGGERTLTSIALLFAVSQVNPPPFLVLDETDAALDEANSKKYGDMLEELSKTTQLIVITHNRETMSRAGIIYGITSGTDAVSKVLSIKFEEAEGMMAR